MNEVFVNKVAESGIITIDLESFFPKEEVVVFDLKAFLYMELILKEKEFREALKQIEPGEFTNKIVALTCSADAIIPIWAYMLVTSLLEPVAKEIVFGDKETAIRRIMIRNISAISNTDYTDKRVVIKGCGELPIPEEAYIEITKQLRPVVKSIMYGEPCSTVPVFKKQATKD